MSLTMVAYWSMIPAGVCAAGWGLWASSHGDAAWVRWLAALSAPAGVLIAAIGALLVILPDFFAR